MFGSCWFLDLLPGGRRLVLHWFVKLPLCWGEAPDGSGWVTGVRRGRTSPDPGSVLASLRHGWGRWGKSDHTVGGRGGAALTKPASLTLTGAVGGPWPSDGGGQLQCLHSEPSCRCRLLPGGVLGALTSLCSSEEVMLQGEAPPCPGSAFLRSHIVKDASYFVGKT